MLLFAAQAVRRFSRGTALILLLAPLVFAGRALFTGGIYGPVDLAYTAEPLASVADRAGVKAVANPALSDVYTEFFPWNDALRRSIRRGEWPLWNPYELCGTPLAGAAQVAPYHPITLIGLLAPLPGYFAFAAAMLYLVAAASAFLLAREFTEAEIGPLFAAIAWMASTHMIFFAGTAMANAVSVTPLVLLGGRRVVLDPGRRSAALLIVALLLLVLSGHPETVLHVVAFAVAYVVFEIAITRPPHLARVLVAGLIAGIAALLLSAIFLLPHLEAIVQSEEYVHRALGYLQRASTPAQMVHRLRASFFPFLEGAPGVEEPAHEPALRHGWIPTAYAGSLVLAPAIYGLWRGRDRRRWFFLAAIVWGLGSGIAAPGFVDLFNRVHGFALAVNDRMMVLAVLGMAILAAIGLDVLQRRLAVVLAITAIVILVAAFLPTGVTPDYLRINALRALLPILLSIAAVIILTPRTAAAALAALLLLQRATETQQVQPTLPARAFYPDFPGRALMRAHDPFRIVGVGYMFTPAISTHYGLEDVRGFQALTFFRYQAMYPLWCKRQPVWFNRVDDLNAPFLSMMNVRFALIEPEVPLPSWWVVRGSFPAYRIVENTRVLPRAFVPRRIHYTTERQSDWFQDVSLTEDFAELSVIETGWVEKHVPNGPGQAIAETRGGRVVVQAAMASPGWIVITNAAWKGWRATADGKSVPIRFANHAFIGVLVPAGQHRIELTYRPRSFEIGAAISLVTLMTCLLGFRARP
jgi:hypothetical protein